MKAETLVKPIDILMVEDNPGDVQLTREALEDCKMCNHLHVVEDGEEAIKFLKQQGSFDQSPTPDLIILDLNLPKKDGREVLTEIKADDHLKTIPVVVLTTSKSEEDVLKSYALHANCYITKPIDLEQFIEVVHSIEHFWIGIVALPNNKQCL